MDLGQIWGFPYMVAFIIDSTAEKVLYIYIQEKNVHLPLDYMFECCDI